MRNEFYEEVERQLLNGDVVFDRLSGFIQEGLCAYRERNAGLAPVASYGSELYYEGLLSLRLVNPQGFACSYSSVTSNSLDRYLTTRDVSAARAA